MSPRLPETCRTSAQGARPPQGTGRAAADGMGTRSLSQGREAAWALLSILMGRIGEGGTRGPDMWSKHVVGGPGRHRGMPKRQERTRPASEPGCTPPADLQRQSRAEPRWPISNPRSRRARARRPVRSLYARRAVVPAASRQETGGRRHQLPAPCALRVKRPCWALGGKQPPKAIVTAWPPDGGNVPSSR